MDEAETFAKVRGEALCKVLYDKQAQNSCLDENETPVAKAARLGLWNEAIRKTEEFVSGIQEKVTSFNFGNRWVANYILWGTENKNGHLMTYKLKHRKIIKDNIGMVTNIRLTNEGAETNAKGSVDPPRGWPS